MDRTKLTKKLKQRFCKDSGVPIKVFSEPFFEDRVLLYDKVYDSQNKYNEFLEYVKKFETEDEFFKDSSDVIDSAINYIKSTREYQSFLEQDMNSYRKKQLQITKSDIYKETNDGKDFLSVDIRKANFNALKFVNKSIVANKESYEDFLTLFTNEDYLIKSKHIRQVIFGNLSPKRQRTVELYLINSVLDLLLGILNTSINSDNIACINNDELIIDLTKSDNPRLLQKDIEEVLSNSSMEIPLRIERFTLKKIGGIKGYLKMDSEGAITDIKAINSLYTPLLLRKLKNEELKESDKVFFHEGNLAKLLEVPEILID